MSHLLDLLLSSANKGRTLPTVEREERLRDKRLGQEVTSLHFMLFYLIKVWLIQGPQVVCCEACMPVLGASYARYYNYCFFYNVHKCRKWILQEQKVCLVLGITCIICVDLPETEIRFLKENCIFKRKRESIALIQLLYLTIAVVFLTPLCSHCTVVHYL